MLGRAALGRILSDLAPGGVCLAAPVARRTGGLLHHRFTLTGPRRSTNRRSVLCGTDPAGCPGWLLATTLPCGARTFLDPAPRCGAAAARPTHSPRSLGVRQHLGAIVGDEQGVLELRGPATVLGDDGPAVVPHVVVGGAEVEHRLDGEGHPDPDLVVEALVVVVGDDQAGVERRADAVPGEVADDAVAEPLGVRLDDAPDHVDPAARLDRLDRPVERLPRALHEEARLLVDVAGEEGGVGVAVDATDEGGDVDVDDV